MHARFDEVLGASTKLASARSGSHIQPSRTHVQTAQALTRLLASRVPTLRLCGLWLCNLEGLRLRRVYQYSAHLRLVRRPLGG